MTSKTTTPVQTGEPSRTTYRRKVAEPCDVPADDRVFTLTLRAEKGVSPERALRNLLRSVLRQHGVRCMTIRPGGAS